MSSKQYNNDNETTSHDETTAEAGIPIDQEQVMALFRQRSPPVGQDRNHSDSELARRLHRGASRSQRHSYAEPSLAEVARQHAYQCIERDAILAARLQAEDCPDVDDTMLAARLHAQATLDSDARLAAMLQRQEQEEEREKRKQLEIEEMKGTIDGRAWLFVHKVIELHEQLALLPSGNSAITTVAMDDMVFLTKKFLEKQKEFQMSGKPHQVTLAYHYTHSACMSTIRQDGLMTLADRKRNGAGYQTRVGAFGDGVYTATNPFAFHGHCGCGVGLIVAVVKGNTKRVGRSEFWTSEFTEELESMQSLVGNKRAWQAMAPAEPSNEQVKFFDEHVLKMSSQCLPLMQFDASVISTKNDNASGNECVWTHHRELQRLLDEFFNDGVETTPIRIPPSLGFAQGSDVASRQSGNGQPHRIQPGSFEVLHYQAPATITVSTPSDAFQRIGQYCGSKADCAICMLPLHSMVSVVRLPGCHHAFHEHCIETSMRIRPWCPVCRELVQEPQGHCPSGTMTIRSPSLPISGYEQYGGGILITYSLPRGIQLSYHENPGQRYIGSTRQAFLPNNQEGRRLLKRLKYAWLHGLTFTIGTSLTANRPNSIIWGSIHHKTSPNGGPRAHGFPDEDFFMHCNEELDSLGVPPWDSCP